MYDVFISYAREDWDDFTRPLYLALSNLNIDIWLDEEKLVLGKPCKEDIRKAIEESNYGIALLTENYFKKEKEESTLYELSLFKKKLDEFEGFILPVVCGHVEHILKTEEYSFLNKPYRTDWNKGIITVIKEIVKEIQSELLNSNIELLIYRDPPIPKNQHDASVLISLYKDAGRNEEASEFALKYLKQHPKDSTILNFYVNSVEATNNAYLIANAIGRIYEWFKEKPDDQGVREKFMNFAKRRVKHAEWVIEDMSEWLINNHSINLIVSYLSLVFERGTTEQVERAIKEGKKWLLEKDSSPVRVPYFNLVVKRGNQEQKKEILKETMLWLDENQKDRILRTIYYKYIKDHGDLEQKQGAIEWCEKWLDGNKNNNFLIPTYLDLVEDLYLFTWDNVPGKDSQKLLRYLWDDLNIGWARNAEIRKSDDDKTALW